jgi:hypothetical protein
MTGYAIELRRGPGIIVAPVLLAAGLVYAASTLQTLTLWSATTGAVANSPFLLGPLAAGVAAWTGARAPRRGAWYGTGASVQGPVIAGIVEIGALVTWVLLAYGTLAMLLFMPTLFVATWGGPSWLWIVTSAVGLCSLVVIGWLIGRLAPLRLTPFGVAVGGFIAAMWVDAVAGRWWWSNLFPLKVWIVRPFDEIRPALLIAQAAWLSGVCVAALAILSVRTKGRLFAVVGLSTIAVVAMVAGGIGVAAAGPDLATPGVNVEFVCEGVSPQVCVHPAYSGSLQELRRRAQRISHKVAGTPFSPARFEHRPRGLEGGIPGPGALGFGFDAPTANNFDRAAFEMATGVFGVGENCLSRGDQAGAGLSSMALLVHWAASDDYAPNERRREAWNWLNSQDTVMARQWINANTDKIKSCSLDLSDFR